MVKKRQRQQKKDSPNKIELLTTKSTVQKDGDFLVEAAIKVKNIKKEEEPGYTFTLYWSQVEGSDTELKFYDTDDRSIQDNTFVSKIKFNLPKENAGKEIKIKFIGSDHSFGFFSVNLPEEKVLADSLNIEVARIERKGDSFIVKVLFEAFDSGKKALPNCNISIRKKGDTGARLMKGKTKTSPEKMYGKYIRRITFPITDAGKMLEYVVDIKGGQKSFEIQLPELLAEKLVVKTSEVVKVEKHFSVPFEVVCFGPDSKLKQSKLPLFDRANPDQPIAEYESDNNGKLVSELWFDQSEENKTFRFYFEGANGKQFPFEVKLPAATKKLATVEIKVVSVKKGDEEITAQVELTGRDSDRKLLPGHSINIFDDTKPSDVLTRETTSAEGYTRGKVQFEMTFPLGKAGQTLKYFAQNDDGERFEFSIELEEAEDFWHKLAVGLHTKKMAPIIGKSLGVALISYILYAVVQVIGPVLLTFGIAFFIFFVAKTLRGTWVKGIMPALLFVLFNIVFEDFAFEAVSNGLFLLVIPGVFFYAAEELSGENVYPWAILKWVLTPLIVFSVLLAFFSPYYQGFSFSIYGMINEFRNEVFLVLPNYMRVIPEIHLSIDFILSLVEDIFSFFPYSREIALSFGKLAYFANALVEGLKWLLVSSVIISVTLFGELRAKYMNRDEKALEDKEPKDSFGAFYVIALTWVMEFLQGRVFSRTKK